MSDPRVNSIHWRAPGFSLEVMENYVMCNLVNLKRFVNDTWEMSGCLILWYLGRMRLYVSLLSLGNLMIQKQTLIFAWLLPRILMLPGIYNSMIGFNNSIYMIAKVIQKSSSWQLELIRNAACRKQKFEKSRHTSKALEQVIWDNSRAFRVLPNLFFSISDQQFDTTRDKSLNLLYSNITRILSIILPLNFSLYLLHLNSLLIPLLGSHLSLFLKQLVTRLAITPTKSIPQSRELTIIEVEVHVMRRMASSTVDYRWICDVFSIVDHDGPDVDEAEQCDVSKFLEWENEGEDVVR